MPNWHSITADEALSQLGSTPQGLSSSEAAKRLQDNGPNQIESPSKPSPINLFLEQFKEYLTLVLIFAAIISYIAGETHNSYVILGIVLLVALIGFLQEYKAERSMEALREMVSPEADVYRDGKVASIPARDLVPGDIIFLEAGDKVPADGRIMEETMLEVIEASLTGESLPVGKGTDPLPEEMALADRKNMVFMGTIVSYGNCRSLVTATGHNTELGRISSMIKQEEEEPPLKKKLAQLAKRQAMLVLAITVLVFIMEVNRGSPVVDVFVTAVALAVAGVPEALPFVVTLAMAFGTQVMAKKNAIIRSLPAVETLGSTTVICTDKTGTLTTGETTVREIRTHRTIEVTGSGYGPQGSFLMGKEPVDVKDQDIDWILKIGALCNNTNIEQSNGKWRIIGDPTEGALIVAAQKAGMVDAIRNSYVEILEYPFDSDRKRMTTIHRSETEGQICAMKGATEAVLERSVYLAENGHIRPLESEDRIKIQAAADEMARKALRVLALAWKPMDVDSPQEMEYAESEMIFTGLVGMMDPPRAEVKKAISTCQQAGIRIVMITGDHQLTARAIGDELGMAEGDVIDGQQLEKMDDREFFSRIEGISIFARVTAQHKMRIVEALKSKGHIVAMTGDGVNDAPALKASDIGIAMGKNGTEVAKEASDIVITDDNFATIVSAVEEGRRIYDNIRKGTAYLLSVSFAEVATVFLAILLNLPVPLLAAQILWINIVAEEFPAIGLAVEPTNAKIMKRKPRDPKEPMPSNSLLLYTLGTAAAIVTGCLGLYMYSLNLGRDLEYARTMAFACLGLFTVFSAYVNRSLDESVLKMKPLGNKMLIYGILASIVAILAAVYVPFMQNIFQTVPLNKESWIAICIVSSLIIVVGEVLKKVVPGIKQTD
jgi:P-type Ca2+ transporter type 2C